MALKSDEFGLYKCEKDIIVKSIGQSFKGVSIVLDVIMEQIKYILNIFYISLGIEKKNSNTLIFVILTDLNHKI